MTLLAILYICGLCILLIILVLYLSSLTLTNVPFLSLSRVKLPDILAALDMHPESVLYELGCGDGRVVLATAKAHTAAKCVGIEYALAPLLLARINYFRAGKPHNVSIRRQNIFSTDLTEATHVFCFLYPHVMVKLHKKFQRELPAGAIVVSCDFEIPTMLLKQKIPFSKPSSLGRTLYVYEY